MRTDRLFPHKTLALAALTSALLAHASYAAPPPTAGDALDLKPVQPNVEYDTPPSDQLAKCSIKSEAREGWSGWVVLDPAGQTLRRFLDTNADKKVDLWCYFRDGLEVYRDMDTDFDGKADQYRWLATGGTRWGLDPNEDGQIDSWKMISPEEVSAEIVAALRDKDAGRFQRLLPTPEEIESLGLSVKTRDELSKRVKAAASGFSEFAASQKLVLPKSQWLQFGGTRPSAVPAGSDGSTKDLIIYDNTAAIIDTEGKHGQLVLGTLVNLGNSWRLLDLPASQAGEGFFFTAIFRNRSDDGPPANGVNEQMQKTLADLEQIDKSLPSAAVADRPKLHAQRATLLEQLADQAPTASDRQTWVRQFVDTISAAVQSGEFPGGIDRLKAMCDKLAASSDAGDLRPFSRFRYMTAEYGLKVTQPNVEFPKVQEQWLKDLEAFVNEYPTAEETAEALLQLAIAQEFAGKEEDALRWYARIVKDFPKAALATKAAGAKRRLESVGQSISLRGKTLTGTTVDLDQLRGRIVLVHYWATWCDPCKRDLQTLKTLQAKYSRSGFTLIGISLDNDAQTLDQYIRSQQLSWPQLYEPGGLDSRLANELGILTLPTMLLIDKNGRVARRNIHVGELEEELQKMSK